jgi:hypothetical protein
MLFSRGAVEEGCLSHGFSCAGLIACLACERWMLVGGEGRARLLGKR